MSKNSEETIEAGISAIYVDKGRSFVGRLEKGLILLRSIRDKLLSKKLNSCLFISLSVSHAFQPHQCKRKAKN
jgi:hypothetical protein